MCSCVFNAAIISRSRFKHFSPHWKNFLKNIVLRVLFRYQIEPNTLSFSQVSKGTVFWVNFNTSSPNQPLTILWYTAIRNETFFFFLLESQIENGQKRKNGLILLWNRGSLLSKKIQVLFRSWNSLHFKKHLKIYSIIIIQSNALSYNLPSSPSSRHTGNCVNINYIDISYLFFWAHSCLQHLSHFLFFQVFFFSPKISIFPHAPHKLFLIHWFPQVEALASNYSESHSKLTHSEFTF